MPEVFIRPFKLARMWAGLLGFAVLIAAAERAEAEVLTIPIGEARSVKLDNPANTAVVGNVETADASIAFGDTVVVIGKQRGATNLIVYDDNGSEIYNSTINVVSASGENVVTIIEGSQSQRTVMECVPALCIERREPEAVSVTESETRDQGGFSSSTTTRHF